MEEEWLQQVLPPPTHIIKGDGGKTLLLILPRPTQVQDHQVLAGALRAVALLAAAGCAAAATHPSIMVGEAIRVRDQALLVPEDLLEVAGAAHPVVAEVEEVEVAAIIQAEAAAEINS